MHARISKIGLIILLTAAAIAAKSHHKKPVPKAASFDYYLLTLSYAPDFCDQSTGNKDPRECGAGRHVGFVVHGMWPQDDTGRGPENCAPSSPVAQNIVQAMLNYIPTESLIQHEWTTHGTCSGLSAADYFAAVRKARDSVNLPSDLKQPSQALHLTPDQIAAELAASNPSFPKQAFRVTCYHDGELQEVRICINKDLSPRGCGSSAGSCAASSVVLNPVR